MYWIRIILYYIVLYYIVILYYIILYDALTESCQAEDALELEIFVMLRNAEPG